MHPTKDKVNHKEVEKWARPNPRPKIVPTNDAETKRLIT